jgi:endo-1,4-beta-xylanase
MKFRQINLLLIFSVVLISYAAFGQIKPIAAGKPKFLGCALSSAQTSGFASLWNQVTPENGGKWGSVEGARGAMNWIDMDASYNAAKKYGMLFKEHTLIWGAQQPSWIAALDTASQRIEINQWFSLLAARYPDIDYIDVVNEPLHNAPNGMLPWGATVKNVDYAKSLGGAGKTGWDWIITSFRMARKYFPKSKLIINEYSVINSTTETQNYIKIIKLLQAEKLIDGIGEQAHAFTTSGATAATMKANLDLLGATGLPIYLTEMDIDGSTDLIQLNEMKRVFTVFWAHPSAMGITMWDSELDYGVTPKKLIWLIKMAQNDLR